MTISTLYLINLFLVFIRILAVFTTAPIFSNRSIPAMTKIGFVGLLSLIILPISGTTDGINLAEIPTDSLFFLFILMQEILIGVVIGFVSNLVFMTIGIAASMVSLQIGLRTANLFNPLIDAPTSALEQFYTLLAIALFFSIDGHHWFIKAVVRTFEVAPLGTFVLNEITIEKLTNLTSEIFIAATRLALPIIGTLLLTDLGLGLVARAVPQIQVFFLGLPLKIGLGLVTLVITLALTLPILKEMFSDMVINILTITSH